ncbi:hypothetical protein FOL47_001443 [Perkinsus chesapeaki]|uniref:Uncharacterized protein n=1 Tax=Perkinsus chesapeaki TaxID=330153 RepID=A0A7J6MKP6_PERCH|nr:hypothetical protein FOL47_001443 [Perkinsus chesapeaki]
MSAAEVGRTTTSSDESTSEEGLSEPPIRSDRSLFIFDWDDTLFPTSAFIEQTRNVDGYDEEALKSCLDITEKLLREAIAMSLDNKIYIVTAAHPAWVFKCAKRSSPGILSLIDGTNPKVEVKSTTGLASKARSMVQMAVKHRKSDEMHTVSLVLTGNSRCDLNPARLLSKVVPRSYVKCVKMKSVPTVDDLCRQLSKLYSVLPRIVSEQSHKTYVMCPEEARALMIKRSTANVKGIIYSKLAQSAPEDILRELPGQSRSEDVVYISWVEVDDGWRNKRVASRMFAKALKAVCDHDVAIELLVKDTTEMAASNSSVLEGPYK